MKASGQKTSAIEPLETLSYEVTFYVLYKAFCLFLMKYFQTFLEDVPPPSAILGVKHKAKPSRVVIVRSKHWIVMGCCDLLLNYFAFDLFKKYPSSFCLVMRR